MQEANIKQEFSVSETTKKNLNRIVTIAISLAFGMFSILGIQRAQANTEKDEAVAYAKVDTTAMVMLDDHSRRLNSHDSIFITNSEEHQSILSQLDVYNNSQAAITQAQVSLEKTQERMEISRKEFQVEMRSDIKQLIKETSTANAWITSIDKVPDNSND